MNRFEQFEEYCIDVTPILDAISRNGLGIDREEQSKFLDRMRQERDAIFCRIQNQIPPRIFKEKVWKRPPKNLDRVYVRMGPDGKNQWYKTLDWNPRSWQQVGELAKVLGCKLPKKVDSEDVTTEAKHLKKLFKKYPVFRDIYDYRQRDKLVTSYAWPIAGDGRVHPTFGYHPSTWRKSCRNPNIQTIPKRSDLAKAFRKMIVPRPGHILIEGDSAAIEAVLVGYLANSPNYIRLARSGVHGWLTSALHGEFIPLSLSDGELAARCANAKKSWPEDYEKCKRVVHLSNYAGTPHRIVEEYPDEFSSESDARKLQDFYFSTDAGKDVRAWQKATVELAHANKGLENHFGLRHRFFTLYQWNAYRQSWEFGEDAKRAIAFVPQSDASFVQSDILIRLVQRDARFLDWVVALVHDSIVCDVPIPDAEYCATVLYEEMTRPLVQLGGLSIGCEIKQGANLGEMIQWQPRRNDFARIVTADHLGAR